MILHALAEEQDTAGPGMMSSSDHIIMPILMSSPRKIAVHYDTSMLQSYRPYIMRSECRMHPLSCVLYSKLLSMQGEAWPGASAPNLAQGPMD